MIKTSIKNQPFYEKKLWKCTKIECASNILSLCVCFPVSGTTKMGRKKKKNMFLVVAPLVRESPCDTLTGVYIRTRVYVGGRQTNKCAVC